MYYTEKDPFSGEPLFVEKEMGKKEKQKKDFSGEKKEVSIIPR